MLLTGDPSRRREDEIHRDVVGFGRDGGNQLLVESDSTLYARVVCISEKPVVKPLPPSEPLTAGIESYSRDQHKVQLVQQEHGGGGGGFKHAEAPEGERRKTFLLRQYRGGIEAGFGNETGQCDGFAGVERRFQDSGKFDLVLEREIAEEVPSRNPLVLLEQYICGGVREIADIFLADFAHFFANFLANFTFLIADIDRVHFASFRSLSNSARHFSTRSLIFFSTPWSVGS